MHYLRNGNADALQPHSSSVGMAGSRGHRADHCRRHCHRPCPSLRLLAVRRRVRRGVDVTAILQIAHAFKVREWPHARNGYGLGGLL